MKKINMNIMERYLLLLDRFVDKLNESGFSEAEITAQSYLFCAGFYIKYQQDIENLTFSNREVVLSFLLLSYYCHIEKISDDLIDKPRLNKVFLSIISFITNNGGRTERIYMHEKKKYDANKLIRASTGVRKSGCRL
ncbi:hypothetical protein [Pectobacterium zantedeschiae]|uniref:Uncharacterized protein n=1 Tax=Pectobacterium zantedeschiae TaxID=2034769 RepID=A0A9X8JJB0_9GAMM|nr:hypothetical protein [Pectobacterium zantedeschiae]RYC38209.1 hypothetical protein CTN06_17585 [Pectobacterium zantedeschiae]RYC44855.1 hypothetical protein CLR69_07570 [Pectobacterium zantedeschiae]RYC50006.1 hypothetical protein CTN06_03370 [Pectobacterium zantedeschiae]